MTIITKGQFQNNLPHGKGIYTYNSGAKHTGNFKNGKFHGHGKHVVDNLKKYSEEGISDHHKCISNYSEEGTLFIIDF